MNINESQGHWILQLGFCDQGRVSLAYEESFQRGVDMLTIMLERQWLTNAQAESVRSAMKVETPSSSGLIAPVRPLSVSSSDSQMAVIEDSKPTVKYGSRANIASHLSSDIIPPAEALPSDDVLFSGEVIPSAERLPSEPSSEVISPGFDRLEEKAFFSEEEDRPARDLPKLVEQESEADSSEASPTRQNIEPDEDIAADNPKTLILGVTIAGLLFLMALTAVLWMRSRPLKFTVTGLSGFSVRLEKAEKATFLIPFEQSKILIRANEGSALTGVECRGQYFSLTDGEVTVPINCPERNTQLIIRPCGLLGKKGPASIIHIQKDADKPSIEILSLPKSCELMTVTGRVSEPCQSVTINGEAATLNGLEFQWTIDSPINSKNLIIEAKDLLGLTATKRLPVLVVRNESAGQPRGTHERLEQAINDAESGDLIYLLSPSNEIASRVRKTLKIIGKDGCRVSAKLKEGEPLLHILGGHLTLKNLNIDFEAHLSPAIRMTQGSLFLQSCRWSISKLSKYPAISIEGPDRGRGPPPYVQVLDNHAVFTDGAGRFLKSANAVLEMADLSFIAKDEPLPTAVDHSGVIEIDRGTYLELERALFERVRTAVSARESFFDATKTSIKSARATGLYCEFSDIWLRDCAILDCTDTGIRIRNKCILRMRGTRLLGNGKKGQEPALHSDHNGRIQATQCRFEHNYGTALRLEEGTFARLVECQFQQNGKRDVKVRKKAEVHITRSVFEDPKTLGETEPMQFQKGTSGIIEECHFKVSEGWTLEIEEKAIVKIRQSTRDRAFQIKKSKGSEVFEEWIPERVLEMRKKSRRILGEIVVDQRGRGDYQSLAQALSDINKIFSIPSHVTIILKPGTYKEVITVNKHDLTIRGDGPRENIVVTQDDQRAVMSANMHLTLKNLTLVKGFAPTQGARSACKVFFRGRLTIEDCLVRVRNGSALTMHGSYRGAGSLREITNHGPKPVLNLRNCEFHPGGYGGLMIYDAVAFIDGSVIHDDQDSGPNKRPNLGAYDGSFARVRKARILNSRIEGILAQNSHVWLRQSSIENSQGPGLRLNKGYGQLEQVSFKKNSGGDSELLEGSQLVQKMPHSD